jgi:hypothetical protein
MGSSLEDRSSLEDPARSTRWSPGRLRPHPA